MQQWKKYLYLVMTECMEASSLEFVSFIPCSLASQLDPSSQAGQKSCEHDAERAYETEHILPPSCHCGAPRITGERKERTDRKDRKDSKEEKGERRKDKR